MMVALSLPPSGDPRLQQPVGISSCGKTRNTGVPLEVKADSCVRSNESTRLFFLFRHFGWSQRRHFNDGSLGRCWSFAAPSL